MSTSDISRCITDLRCVDLYRILATSLTMKDTSWNLIQYSSRTYSSYKSIEIFRLLKSIELAKLLTSWPIDSNQRLVIIFRNFYEKSSLYEHQVFSQAGPSAVCSSLPLPLQLSHIWGSNCSLLFGIKPCIIAIGYSVSRRKRLGVACL